MKYKIKDICNDILLFGLLFIVSELLFRCFILFQDEYMYYIIFDIGFAVILSFILLLIHPSKRRKFGFGILLFFNIYMMAQIAHETFFEDFFTITKITIIQELLEVKGSTLSSYNLSLLLMLLPSVFYWLSYKYLPKVEKIKKIKFVLGFATGILLLFGTSCMLKHQFNINKQNNTSIPHQAESFVKGANRFEFVNYFGVSEYLYKDIKDTISWKLSSINYSDDEMKKFEKFVDKYSEINTNEYSSMFEGKNVIMILCESLVPSVIDKELTPTLYELQTKGINFQNHYVPLYEYNTADSEFISLTGMLPSINYGLVNESYSRNKYPKALPNLFKEKGYSVNSYHSGTKVFYNRVVFHRELGFDYFYDYESLNLQPFDDFTLFYNWFDDENLFNAMLERTDFSKPFFNFVISGSGHMPYFDRIELTKNYEIVNSIEKYQNLNEEAKFYYAAQMKLDQGLEALINGLKEKDELENTVIILYSDHYPYGLTNKEVLDEVVDTSTNVSKMKGNFIVYNTNSNHIDVDTISSTFDIYPTISNLFGLNNEGWYFVGTDALNVDSKHYVLFKDYSVLFNGTYYKNSKDIKDEYLRKKINEIEKYGENLLISNYYQTKTYKNKK